MRRPVFKRWIRSELMRLHGTGSFCMRTLAAAAQDGEARLVEPLLLYAVANDCVDTLRARVWNADVGASYGSALAALDGNALATAEDVERACGRLPRSYGKFLTSFLAAYHEPETLAESKRMRWQAARQWQLRTGISSTQVSRALGLDVGNVNAFLKDGAIERVSLANATRIMAYLASEPDALSSTGA